MKKAGCRICCAGSNPRGKRVEELLTVLKETGFDVTAISGREMKEKSGFDGVCR